MRTLKKKKCRECGDLFQPFKTTDPVCSVGCAIAYAKKTNARKRKQVSEELQRQVRKDVREMKERIKTYGQWLQELQVIFNRHIRIRDKGKPCISCDKALIQNPTAWKAQYDAGHFYSVGAYPNLRFNEDNVHGQCVRCNRDLHSNNTEYSIRLPERIGVDRFIELKSIRHKEPLKLSIPEIKELKSHYRKLIRSMA